MPIPLPDNAYTLPSVIVEDPTMSDLVELYEVIIHRLREEASGLTMSTVQEMLLERMGSNYIQLRWRERRAFGEGGFEHSSAQKDFNSFWLAMTREFTKLTQSTDADFRDSLLKQVNGAISSALEKMHPDVAAGLKDSLASALAEAGVGGIPSDRVLRPTNTGVEMAKDESTGDEDIQHFESSFLKINADGDQVLSDHLAPGERLAVEQPDKEYAKSVVGEEHLPPEDKEDDSELKTSKRTSTK